MNRHLPITLALLLAGGLVAAQNEPLAPKPRINRNPVFRQSLPPALPLPPDPRDTVVPQPGPDDPRDSDTRPVLPADSKDERDIVWPAPGMVPPLPGPTSPRPGPGRP